MIVVVVFGLFLTAFTLGAVVGLQLQNEKPSSLSTAGDVEAALRAARELSDEDIAALAQTLVVAKVSDPVFLLGEYLGKPEQYAVGCGIRGCGAKPIHARVIRKTDGEVMKVCCLHFRYYRWAYALVPHPLYPEENCRLRDDRLELPVGDLEAYRELSKAKQRAESLIIE